MKRFKISSIRARMVLIFVACSVIIAITMGSICFLVLYSTMKEQTQTAIKTATNNVNRQIALLMQNGERIIDWGQVETVRNFFYGEGERHAEAAAMVAAFQTLRDSNMIDSSISNIYLYDVDGYGYNYRTGLFKRDSSQQYEAIYETIFAGTDKLQIFEDDEKENPVILLSSAVLQPATKKVLGYVVVEYDADALINALKDVTLGESGRFFITDDRSNIIPTNNENLKFDLNSFLSAVRNADGIYVETVGETLLAGTKLEGTNWYVVGQASRYELMSGFRSIVIWLSVSITGVLLITIMLYVYISKRMTYPIERLKDCMLRTAGGDLQAKVTNMSDNEFGVLELQYNRMLTEINELITRNREEQRELQKAELRALQAQINPHFLYNTLDGIMWLVAAEDKENAIGMLEQLSIFFRIGLSKGMDWISVREDVQHLYSYLYIQRFRYSDRLKFEIDVDENVQNMQILKLTLQPIVENAIYHGIKEKKDGGTIYVSGKLDDNNDLMFIVRDTGNGMTEERCAELRRRLSEDVATEKPDSFGLYNVNKRIKLYCGDKYGLEIESKLNEGTTITVRIAGRVAG